VQPLADSPGAGADRGRQRSRVKPLAAAKLASQEGLGGLVAVQAPAQLDSSGSRWR
jgi:hypothetical protein